MRLGGVVIAVVVFVSVIAFARNGSGRSSSGFGSSASFSGSSSSGGAHSSSGGSGSSASSAGSHNSSSSASHGSSTGGASSRSSPSAKLPSTKGSASPETKSSRSLFHPFRNRKPVQIAESKRSAPCLKQPCAICPPGQSPGGRGGCVAPRNACSSGQGWNGFSCGTEGWFNDCRVLAEQLAEQQRQMRGQNDPGQSLRRQLLLNQYDHCAKRFGLEPFGSYLFSDARQLDVP
jgi:hypothetical protein